MLGSPELWPEGRWWQLTKILKDFHVEKLISQLQVAPEGETRMKEELDQMTDFLPQFDPAHNHTSGFIHSSCLEGEGARD